MNDMTGCQHVRQSLGVYVLGAIDPAERADVDAHLAGCAECREELAGLAGLPALLGRVPFGEAQRIADLDHLRPAPGSDTLSPLLARIAHRRRVSRWRGLAAVAAAALLAAGAAVGVTHAAGGSAGWQTAQGHAGDVSVVVRYAGKPWGTALDTRVSGIPAGTTCEFWVMGSRGQEWSAGSWTVASGYQATWFPGSSSVPASAVRGFEITSGARVLVQVPT